MSSASTAPDAAALVLVPCTPIRQRHTRPTTEHHANDPSKPALVFPSIYIGELYKKWIDLTDDYTVAPFYSDDLEHAVDDTGMVMFVAGIDEDAGMIFRNRVPLERIL